MQLKIHALSATAAVGVFDRWRSLYFAALTSRLELTRCDDVDE
jgi:hypothetical protein